MTDYQPTKDDVGPHGGPLAVRANTVHAEMMQFGVKVKPEKAQRSVGALQAALFPGERLLFFGKGSTIGPGADRLALTNGRLLLVYGVNVVKSWRYDEIETVASEPEMNRLTIETGDGKRKRINGVAADDHPAILQLFNNGRAAALPMELALAYAEAEADDAARSAFLEAADNRSWPGTKVKGSLSRKASNAIARLCHNGETPWLIVASGGALGVLVGFDDRLAIIKTGAMTSFMAGSFGGERSATFHYRDITGIEYNSGILTGVLEILTASYSGTANKDFWRGSGQGRNADSNDPWTLSNTLPLLKPEYNSYLPEINELRARISESKRHPASSSAAQPTAGGDLATQLERLSALNASGVLTDEEFSAAKARLITGGDST